MNALDHVEPMRRVVDRAALQLIDTVTFTGAWMARLPGLDDQLVIVFRSPASLSISQKTPSGCDDDPLRQPTD